MVEKCEVVRNIKGKEQDKVMIQFAEKTTVDVVFSRILIDDKLKGLLLWFF